MWAQWMPQILLKFPILFRTMLIVIMVVIPVCSYSRMVTVAVLVTIPQELVVMMVKMQSIVLIVMATVV